MNGVVIVIRTKENEHIGDYEMIHHIKIHRIFSMNYHYESR